MLGAADEDVLRAATGEGRLLITLDRGFGDIRRHPPGTHTGVIVHRPGDQLASTVTAALRELVLAHPLEDMVGCITIVRSGLSASAAPDVGSFSARQGRRDSLALASQVASHVPADMGRHPSARTGLEPARHKGFWD